MKWFKRILLVLALIALFIVSALITVAIVVDPNDYKPQIETLVETQTGRDLTIEGDIGLSLFPWLGLELTNVSLGNPEGFSEPRFAAVEKVNIKVALLPLFKLQTRVGVLQLKGLRLNLETRADGVSNWEGLGQTGAPEVSTENPAPATKVPETGNGAAAKALAGLYVGGIDVEDAAVILSDETNGTRTRVEHINLSTGTIRINEPIDFKASFSLRNDNPKIIGGMELRGTAVADVNNARYRLTDIALNGKVSGEEIPGHEQTLDLTVAAITVDLNAGTAGVNAVSARLAGLTAGLDASATGINGDAPAVTGKIHLQIDSLKRTLGTLAVPLPIIADDAVLETATFNAGFKAGKDAIEMSDIAAALDDSHLTGQLAVHGFEQPAITFDLALDAINADRYLPPADETGAETPPATGETDTDTDTKIELPVETLRTLNIDGRFRIGALQIMNLKTANIDTGLKAGNGVIDLKPLAVDLYQGKFRGSAGLDVTGDIPRYTSTLQLSGVAVGPLMQDFMDKRLLEGSMNADAAVNTAGNRVSGLMEALNGKFSLAFRDGALSMNVRESLRNLKAKLKGKEPASGPMSEPTRFSSITATGVIENGTVKNQDLEVRARQLYVTGKGSYQLPTDYIDYVLTILLSDDGAGQNDPLTDLYDFPIEFPLKGKLDEIDYASVGLKALGSAVTNKVKAKVDAAKDAARAELQRKQDAARAELEKKEAARKAELQRAEEARKAELERERKAKEEELKKKLEDKKKDALKNLFN